MTQLAAQTAGTSGFNETALRSTLRAIANQARATEDAISNAVAAGWTQGVQHTMSDGVLTRDAEMNLRDFRDRMADQDLPSVVTPSATLGPGLRRPHRCPGPERPPTASLPRPRAPSSPPGTALWATLQELDNTLRRASISNTNRLQLLVRAWETAVEGPWRTACRLWTRRTRWPSTPPTSVWSNTTWTGTASRPD